jgi:hypothetical protein
MDYPDYRWRKESWKRNLPGMTKEGWLEALRGLLATLEGIQNGGSMARDSIPALDTLAS